MPKACRPTLLFAALLALTACGAAMPPPVRQACWEGPAPSCLPPTSAAQAAAARAAAAQPAGPFDDSSHAYVNNPK